MIFNSLDFAIFLPVVFLLYWLVFNKSLRMQNTFLLAASYFFYGYWKWEFLSLILISSITDYFTGLQLHKEQNQRKRFWLLMTSIFINLGMLAYFKYSNFFIDNFNAAFTFLGAEFKIEHLRLILPVGISFYTFQTLSYTIELYWRKIEPERDPITFFAFVSFFPQLVAGPIERAKNLIPQFNKPRQLRLDDAKDGLREILWGLFLKCVIADQASLYVNDIYTNYDKYPGGTIFLGMLYFGLQVYGDFAGYSSVAIGVSKLFGFKLMRNFAYPYTSHSFSEVWRRWHISLMSWFRDYVYKPLGGSKKGRFRTVINILIVFALSGLWHGADWTFVMWGLFTAVLIILDYLKNIFGWQYILDFKFLDGPVKFLRRPVQIIYLLTISSLAAAFFRAQSIGQTFDLFARMANKTIIDTVPKHLPYLWFVVFIMSWEHWMRYRKSKHGLAIADLHVAWRWSIYTLFLVLFFYFFNIGQEYIYFQF